MSMNARLLAQVSTQFVGLHRWPDAPPNVYFLAYPHRHRFLVRVDVPQLHDNRDVEYLTLQAAVESVVATLPHTRRDDLVVCPDYGTLSCEQMARHIGHTLRARFGFSTLVCAVSEDGENGASVVVTRGDDA